MSSPPDFLRGYSIPRRTALPLPRPWRWTVVVDLETSTADIPPADDEAGVVRCPAPHQPQLVQIVASKMYAKCSAATASCDWLRLRSAQPRLR